MTEARSITTDGAPVWVQLQSRDCDSAKKFYGALFGWTFRSLSIDQADHLLIEKDSKYVGSLTSNGASFESFEGWLVFLLSGNLARTIDAAKEQGIVPQYVGPKGRYAKIALLWDASGAVVGAWEPNQIPGFDLSLKAGTPVWFELETTRYDEALRFYQNVFHWQTESGPGQPGFRYATFGSGSSAKAGIYDVRESSGGSGEPSSRWTVYFGVDDTEKAAAQAEELGGAVIQPPQDSAFGKVAHLADPHGAEFKIIQEG